MKSYNVDDKLKDPEIIKKALIKVCKSKKRKKNGRNKKYEQAQRLLENPDKHAGIILNIVLATEIVMQREKQGNFIKDRIWLRSYRPKRCKSFKVKDGPSKKEREIISVPLFPDQVIHQLIIEAAEPVFMVGMYEYSCGSIPKRGTGKGRKYIRKTINHHNEYDKSAIKYVAQLDVTKCYQSISHRYLKSELRRKFRGMFFIYIAFLIIDSYVYIVVDIECYGLPIGYSTSQWFCNFTLTPLDHYIKEVMQVRHYVRYIDDMIFFGKNKKKLHKVIRTIESIIENMGLKLKHNWQVYRFDYIGKTGKRLGRAIDTLGFRFFRDKTILRKYRALAIRRQVQQISKMRVITPHDARSLMSRLGSLRHCNSYNFYHKHVKPYISIRKLKGVIRNEIRKHREAGCAI